MPDGVRIQLSFDNNAATTPGTVLAFKPAALHQVIDDRDVRIANVYYAQAGIWHVRIAEVIHWLSHRYHNFTTDLVWQRLAETGAPTPTNAAAIGPAMLRAAKRGWIARTELMQVSRKPSCGGRRIPVWRSLPAEQHDDCGEVFDVGSTDDRRIPEKASS